jgi:asparagine synthase (glutamine-hydrolysing)
MCGLSAAVTLTKNPNLINRMNSLLKHRGPDQTSFFECVIEKFNVQFGFHRLAITGVSKKSGQPMASENGQYILMFNGEIYNFRELRDKLQKLGARFVSDSDSEVLIHGYDKLGIKFLNLIDGMFSFILLDNVSKLIIAGRDRFGEKPLYYSYTKNGEFFLASEKKAIWSLSKINYAVDLEFVGATLFGLSPFKSQKTNFTGISQLEPGSYLEYQFNNNNLKIEKYWDPKYIKIYDQTFNLSQNLEVLENLLRKSIESRIPDGLDYSLSLSGGIDSSLLAAIILRNDFKSFRNSFSVVFPKYKYVDESVPLELLSQKYSLNNIKISTSAADAVDSMRMMHWHHEDIIPGLSMYLEWALMKTVSNMGYKVILSGQGADELFGGYEHILPYFLCDRFRSGNMYIFNKEVFNFSFRKYKFGSAFSVLKQTAYLYGQKLGFSDIYLNDIKYISLPFNLLGGDRSSMAFGIEQRHPYLSNAVVDFMLGLPQNAFILNGNTKPLLRTLSSRYLPKTIAYPKQKIGYAAPEKDWMKDLVLRNWVNERVKSSAIKSIVGYDKKFIDRISIGFNQGKKIESKILWRWASAVEFIETFK